MYKVWNKFDTAAVRGFGKVQLRCLTQDMQEEFFNENTVLSTL